MVARTDAPVRLDRRSPTPSGSPSPKHVSTTITGQLSIPIVARLPEEQARFVDVFLLGNGSLSQAQKDLGCSHPRARRLLNDTIATIRREFAAARKEKDEILDALEQGDLDGKQAVQLVRSLIGQGD